MCESYCCYRLIYYPAIYNFFKAGEAGAGHLRCALATDSVHVIGDEEVLKPNSKAVPNCFDTALLLVNS